MEDNRDDFQPFIKGKRIYLREVRISDVNENYYRWLNDPEITRYLEIRYMPRSLENIRRFVEGMDGKPDELFLAICLVENDRHIGNIKLGPINWIHRFADISLLIGERSCWGKGLATEAIGILAGFAFNVLNLNKLRAGCYSANIASAKAFIKTGFTKEGVLKNQWILGDEYQDEILLGLCRQDWRKDA